MELTELKSLLAGKTGSEPKPAGEGFTCRCPAHEDQNASLSFSAGRDGLVLKCHAGCKFDAIVAALGIKTADLFYKKPAVSGKPKLVATYDYNDTDGRLLFQVCRFDPKGFRQRRPALKAPGAWIWDLKGVKLVPYRLPELITAAKAGETIFIAEGEKDVAALVANGFPATCNAAGAGKWRDDFTKYFDGAKAVCVIADKDTPGRQHAVAVAASLSGKVPSVKVIELPDAAGGHVKDAHDFFTAGGTAGRLCQIAEAATEFAPPAEPTKTDNNPEPVERVTTGGLICIADVAKISAVPLFYYAEKSSWFAPDSRGGFFKTSCAAAQSFLAASGFSKAFKDSQGNSPAESALFWKMQNNSVAYAGELAGYPAGCHEINARRILVTHSPQMIVPQTGEFPTIARLIETLLDFDDHPQAQIFFAWLASSFVALRERFSNPAGAVFRFAPALYLAGPRECGKSALIKLVLQPLFGGRMADPTSYLRDGKFNKDLFAASLLIIDDKGASSNLAERRQRGEAIKSLIWTEEQRMEGKGADALILTPFRRLVMASNDDEAGLQICPALSPSLVDKLLILRARKADGLPASHVEQDQWAKNIRAELPAFAHWLLQFELPAICELSPRTRLPLFQHPGIVSALHDLQPEMRLLELIDLFKLIGSQPCWEGYATEFEQVMRTHDEKHLLDRIFTSGTTAGKMLTELSRMCPERVTTTPRGGKSFYRIFRATETTQPI
jgi:antitoxin (DNA-binding transcriptional repressor) of toxin-antitoxin stability system